MDNGIQSVRDVRALCSEHDLTVPMSLHDSLIDAYISLCELTKELARMLPE